MLGHSYVEKKNFLVYQMNGILRELRESYKNHPALGIVFFIRGTHWEHGSYMYGLGLGIGKGVGEYTNGIFFHCSKLAFFFFTCVFWFFFFNRIDLSPGLAEYAVLGNAGDEMKWDGKGREGWMNGMNGMEWDGMGNGEWGGGEKAVPSVALNPNHLFSYLSVCV